MNRSGRIPDALEHLQALGSLGRACLALFEHFLRPLFAEPFVEKWAAEQLAIRSISTRTRSDYVRLVRALVPAGVPFPATELTEDSVRRALLALPGVTDATRRRHAAAWRLWTKYVRRRVPEVSDVFAYADEWMPKNSESRTTFWTYETTRKVLDRMSGEARRAMALVFGAGVELGGLLNLRHEHILADRTLVVPGSKTSARKDRTIICSAWAWAIFTDGLVPGFPTMPIFTVSERELRASFYEAQVAAGVVAEPERSSKNKKPLWRNVVGLHHIHDGRHSFAIMRLLGTDGERQRSMKWVSLCLGHADEAMLTRVYSKAGIEQRRMLQLEEEAADEKRSKTS